MDTVMEYARHAVPIGAGATALIDLWALARKRWLGVPALDYAMVGRWAGHLAKGRFRHDRIASSPPIGGERLIGWTAHYLIGIAFAAVLLAACGLPWAARPTPGPALVVGIATAVAPFLVLQPGMGLGIAASRAPRPAAARLQTLVTHAIFGLGLYATARLVA
jgi:hypothetical protein